MSKKQIYITQPDLPPLEDFIPYLKQIWQSKQLTNSGQFHQRFEQELSKYLGVEHVSLFCNGTTALITALQASGIKGEVITTPYTFVATTHSLKWNNLTPVFVDIDPYTCNLDPAKIEAAITPQTSAILPVHCYGIPCNMHRIGQIADTYGLKVIYDAAHAFGVQHQNKSLLQYGDLSMLSFHATKVFNTFEGGAIICHDAKTKQRIDNLKNFGFTDEITVTAPGINGKMSEVNAAFGLLQLQHIDQALARRKKIESRYRELLANVPGISLLPVPEETIGNASYFPILVNDDYPLSRDTLYQKLKYIGIHVRRYFYPLVSEMSIYKGLPSAAKERLPVAHAIASRILCLPIYPSLTTEDQLRICKLILES